MDEKAEVVKMESGAHKSKLVGVSMLLLSLLLTAAVASLIYVAVSDVKSGCQTTKQDSTEVDVKATVKVNGKTSSEEDRIEYSRGGHFVYNYGSNGAFDFDDLRKGIHVARQKEGDICYIMPVGGNQTMDNEIEEFLDEWDGKEIDAGESNEDIQVEIFDGKLTDVSFLPQKVQDECTSGYQWMAIISEKEDTDVAEKSDGELDREKRATCRYHWDYYYCWDGTDRVWRRFLSRYHHSCHCDYYICYWVTNVTCDS